MLLSKWTRTEFAMNVSLHYCNVLSGGAGPNIWCFDSNRNMINHCRQHRQRSRGELCLSLTFLLLSTLFGVWVLQFFPEVSL